MSNLEAMGFWELHGVGGQERHRINDLLTTARQSEYSQQQIAGRVHDLVDVATAHANDIVQLRIAVFALSQMLAEAGLLDPAALNARVQGIRASMAPQPTPAAPSPATPYRGAAPAAPAPPVRTTACAVCAKSVAVSDTLMSERGAVCSDCFAKIA